MNALLTSPSLYSARASLVLTLLVSLIVASAFTFVLVPKRADAFVAAVFSTIVANIPELALRILGAVITKFLMGLLQKATQFAMSKIQNNFVIKNYLTYTAVLSNNKYLEDYLAKYIPSPNARSILRASAKSQNQGGLDLSPPLARQLQADADRYRGFKQAELNPRDPKYLEKMAKQADLWSSPAGWYYAYVDQGFKAKSEADRATAFNIENGAGYKSAFDGNAGENFGNTLTVPAEIDHLGQRLIDSLVDVIIFMRSGEITSAIADFIASFAVARLNSILDRPGAVVYDEVRDFQSVINPNYPPTSTRVDRGALEGEQTTRPPLPRTPDFCAAAQTTVLRTDLGSASATADGGSGPGNPPPSGGSARASVSLDNGRVRVHPDSPPCGGQFSQDIANRMIDMLDYNPNDPNHDPTRLQYGSPPRP